MLVWYEHKNKHRGRQTKLSQEKDMDIYKNLVYNKVYTCAKLDKDTWRAFLRPKLNTYPGRDLSFSDE